MKYYIKKPPYLRHFENRVVFVLQLILISNKHCFFCYLFSSTTSSFLISLVRISLQILSTKESTASLPSSPA